MTKNKIFFSTTLSLLTLSMSVSPIYAKVGPLRQEVKAQRIEAQTQIRDERREMASKAAEIKNEMRSSVEDQKIANRKMSFNKEIEARLNILNRLVNQIFNSKKLTQDQKDTLTTEVKALISQTESLKTTIQAETDLQKLRDMQAQIKSFNQSFNVLYPKINLVIYADKLLEIVQLLLVKTSDQTLVSKLNQVTADTNTAITQIMAISVSQRDSRTQLNIYKKKLVDLRQVINTVRTAINKAITPTATVSQ